MTPRQAPNGWDITDLLEWSKSTSILLPSGKSLPGRPLGLDTIPNRFKLTWAVFTGKADAVFWEKNP